MAHGVFPRRWAKGYVNVLPKSGNLSNPVNWRPITQTCVPPKLLPINIRENSSNSLKIMIENNLINDNQFGFVPGRPTQQAVFETTCDLYHAMNSNLLTGLPRCPEGF